MCIINCFNTITFVLPRLGIIARSRIAQVRGTSSREARKITFCVAYVALRARAWIETNVLRRANMLAMCRPPREGVD